MHWIKGKQILRHDSKKNFGNSLLPPGTVIAIIAGFLLANSGAPLWRVSAK